MQARDWLPDVALYDGSLTSAVASLVDKWRIRWIRTPIKLAVRIDAKVGERHLSASGWTSDCGNLSYFADDRARMRLAASILNSKRVTASPSRTDGILLDRLTDKAIADLMGTLAELFAVRATVQPIGETPSSSETLSSALKFVITGPAGIVGVILASPDAAAAARKRLVKTDRRPHPALQPRANGIAQQPVYVGVRVGSGVVTAADLATLSIGDILILDRRVDETPEMVINGRPTADPDIRLGRDGARLFLQTANKQNGAPG